MHSVNPVVVTVILPLVLWFLWCKSTEFVNTRMLYLPFDISVLYIIIIVLFSEHIFLSSKEKSGEIPANNINKHYQKTNLPDQDQHAMPYTIHYVSYVT